MDDPQVSIRAGQAALKAAQWDSARRSFETALRQTESAEAYDGLGIALWWLNDISASHENRTTAYVQFKEQGDHPRAGLIAAWLGREQVFLHGNVVAMQGWFARAERLLSDVPPCAESAWFKLFRASLTASPKTLQQVALETLEAARQLNEPNLEAASLAFRGQGLVTVGKVSEGMTALDEAMTMATSGEVSNYMTISEIFCVMLSACEAAGDLVRSDYWCKAAEQFAERHQCPPFLSAYCRTTYGSLLTANGRWQDAEAALTDAIRLFDSGHKGLRINAVLKLADLRVHQGKLEEAQVLLSGYEDHGSAVVPLARLYLARGETELARATLEQAIQNEAVLNLSHAPLLILLIQVLLMHGETEAARQRTAQLARMAEQTQSDLLFAQAELANGQVNKYVDQEQALSSFQSALTHLHAQEQSFMAAQARYEMAELLKENDPPGAVAWAKAALATFERLGAAHNASKVVSLLRQLGVATPVSPRLQGELTQRESEVLALVALGLTNREIADRLVISPKTVEHHVSQVLSKLGLRSRAEAIAYTTREKK